MGIDAEVWARVDVLYKEQIQMLKEMGVQVSLEATPKGAITVMANTWSRWFTRSYPRGDWPELSYLLDALTKVFGHAFYTNDHMEYDPDQYDQVFTEQDNASLWKAWNNVGDD